MRDTTQQAIPILDENKASEIVHLDVHALSSITDNMVICTATSQQHARALADKIRRHFKGILHQSPYTEGEEEGNWVLIDLQDTLVHIMTAETRALYRLESLWDPDLS